ncbi:MAG: choice-of-anchor I family protein, partial [Bacteroidia bacterium]
PNPAGTDSPFEFAEFVATRSINFATTPYTVVVCNNGAANSQGWVAGGTLSYAFEINTGTVNQGDVVYVGGSSMAATGTILRAISTGTTAGDGFGTAATGGVFGNGGTNADGIAVFASPVASLTNASVPIDALFFGTATGTAVVNAGADGYQLPFNDVYAGGKLQATSFLAPDPASAQTLVATGTFNPTVGAFTTTRGWVLGTFSNNASTVAISSATPAATVAFATTNQVLAENAGTATITLNVSNSNGAQTVFTVSALPISTATAGTDYTPASTTVIVPPNTNGTQTVTITITDDATLERDEYLILALSNLTNATASATAAHYLYIKDNDAPPIVGSNELFLDLQTSFSNGSSATNSAEIVVHDPSTQRLYIANSIGAKLDILNFANPAAPVLISSIPVSTYGNINSVAVLDSVVAMAIENATNPQDSGKIVFLNYNGVFIKEVKVGAMPDMIAFNHAGTKVYTACEGEPNAAYTNDPDGSVVMVDISGGVANVTQANVTFITFTSFNGQENTLRAQGIRIYGPAATASKDFEPEYITISDNDQKAWVTLQENNAIAEINLLTNTVVQIRPLGYKDYSSGNNALDASDQTAGISISNFPVKGMYMPDALSQFTIGNQVYLITANEGDARAYTGLNEEARVSALPLDATVFPYGAYMKSNLFLGRLNATNKLGDTDNDGDFDEIYTYGSRSFSIWNATTGVLVFDSGDQLEQMTSTHPTFAAMFNASNSTSAATKNRSDDKGPEPEGTAVGKINGENYAFVALERIGGVVIYNISNPASPVFVGYYNNRAVATNGPDRGSEGIIFIPDSLSPNGHAQIILANETSSTLTIFQITTCAERAGIALTPIAPPAICSGDSIQLSVPVVANTTYQWIQNNTPLVGETAATYFANASGAYQVLIGSTTHACSGKTDFSNVSVSIPPTVLANASQPSICVGSSVTLNASGASTYSWMPGNLTGNTISVSPAATTTYTITGTNAAVCTDTATLAIAVNALPTIAANTSQSSICVGSSATLNASGASTYLWMPGSLTGNTVSVSPATTTTYTITGTDVAGCSATTTLAVAVNTLPTITASANLTSICAGSSVTLNASGASTYLWMPGALTGNGVTVAPTLSTTYTVTGTNANGCTNTATVAINALPRPTILANASATTICSGNSVSMTASGATVYTWLPGLLTGNSVTASPNAATTYTVTGVGSNGCSNTATLTIAVNASPVVSASASDLSVCGEANVELVGAGASTYVWMPNSNVGDTITETVNATITYTLIGTAANGCTDSANVTVQVNPIPAVSFSLAQDTFCLSISSIQLSGNPSGGAFSGPGVNGNIFNPSSAQLGANELIYTYTDANGCTNADTTIAYVELCTDIVSLETTEIRVFPNPVTTAATITSNELIDQIEVYDLAGSLIMRTAVNSNLFELNTSELASGIYFLNVFTESKVSTVRIIRL